LLSNKMHMHTVA